MTKSVHGANLFELSKKLNCKIEDFRDFSSNINPFGVSEKALETLSKNLDKASIYPDPNYKKLKNTIATYCKCDEKNILLGSGASAFISSYIKILAPKNAMILSPAYSEYENELKKINANIHPYILREEKNFKIDVDEMIEQIKQNEITIAIICNPNNPTGSIIDKNEIRKIIENTKVNLVIDETYIEFTDIEKYSAVKLCDSYDRLFIIRGTSKFFACPGIRLGYSIISNEKIKQEFEKNYNIFWDINIFADIMGNEMLLDKQYHKNTFDKIRQQREFMIRELKKINSLKVYESYGNFILVKIVDERVKAEDLYLYLLEKKKIIRNCASFSSLGEKYFRVCVLKEDDNKALMINIGDFFSKK